MPDQRINLADLPEDGDFLAAIAALGRQFNGRPPAPAAGPIVAVCGSCSPVSVRQIHTAIADDFAEVILSPNALAAGEINSAVASSVAMVTLALDGGRSVVLHTHCDHRVEHTPADDAHLGDALGRVLKMTLERRAVRRVVVVGGETCGRVARTAGIESVEIVATLGDGLYLCRVSANATAIDIVQFVFKAGAAGLPNAFACIRDRLA